ncbi:MAG: nucleotide exchange factor GrpE [Bacteroidales bacterium]|nr:nucleotide exchange factor GrpE [Bacteroidales bacterium]
MMPKKKQHNQATDSKESKNKHVTDTAELKEESATDSSPGNGTGNKADDSVATDKSGREIKELTEKLAEMQDKYLRLSAEFDNYRKRTLREKIELSKYAGENILTGILPFMDDFERALKHMDTCEEGAPVKEGIILIYQKLMEFLKQNGVKEIESQDALFNVDLHEAVGTVQAPETDKKGKIIEVVLKGYYLQDKVIRHSKVLVGE